MKALLTIIKHVFKRIQAVGLRTRAELSLLGETESYVWQSIGLLEQTGIRAEGSAAEILSIGRCAIDAKSID